MPCISRSLLLPWTSVLLPQRRPSTVILNKLSFNLPCLIKELIYLSYLRGALRRNTVGKVQDDVSTISLGTSPQLKD